jgi:hypothetical protein
MYDDDPNRSMKVKTLLMTSIVVAGLFLTLGIVLGVAWTSSRNRAAPTVLPSSPTETAQSTPSANLQTLEARAKKFILDNEDDPKSVQFVSFGPNDAKGELHALTAKLHVDERMELFNTDVLLFQRTNRVARVRYRSSNGHGGIELRDELVHLDDDGHGTAVGNPYGDAWLEFYRKRFSQDPGARHSVQAPEVPRPLPIPKD